MHEIEENMNSHATVNLAEAIVLFDPRKSSAFGSALPAIQTRSSSTPGVALYPRVNLAPLIVYSSGRRPIRVAAAMSE